MTGNLLAQGMTPRMAVGTGAATGILIGGLVAAPLGRLADAAHVAQAAAATYWDAAGGDEILILPSLMFDPLPVFPRI